MLCSVQAHPTKTPTTVLSANVPRRSLVVPLKAFRTALQEQSNFEKNVFGLPLIHTQSAYCDGGTSYRKCRTIAIAFCTTAVVAIAAICLCVCCFSFCCSCFCDHYHYHGIHSVLSGLLLLRRLLARPQEAVAELKPKDRSDNDVRLQTSFFCQQELAQGAQVVLSGLLSILLEPSLCCEKVLQCRAGICWT